MRRSRQILAILLCAAFLCLGYGLFLRVTGWRAQFAEGNYQTNMIRAQGYLFDAPKPVVLIGSSISGRLLPEYFADAGLELSNLALDGAGVAAGLELAGHRKEQPRVVLLEAYSLGRPIEANDREILAAVEGMTFRLGRWVPILRADARPSSILYTWMKRKREGGSPVSATDKVKQPRVVPVELSPARPAQEAVEHPSLSALPALLEKIASLHAAGVRVVIVRMPAGKRGARSGGWDLVDEVSFRTKTPLLDIVALMEADGGAITYTDGLHMNAASARRAATIIAEAIK